MAGKEHAKRDNDSKSGLKEISFRHVGSPQVFLRSGWVIRTKFDARHEAPHSALAILGQARQFKLLFFPIGPFYFIGLF
jgi:hypothetical protein